MVAGAFFGTAAHAAVGRTPGAFAVSRAGAATYTIPIWAPPGPQGLQPNIALTYNSGRGLGYLGIGWSLGGLSSIYRCNQTDAQDGTPGSVTLTNSDMFCMDGKRLRLISGTYGLAGSVYQTEVADFSNITAYGAAGNGPAYFVVQGRDGRTYTYGNGGNSQVLASGSSTASGWQINEISDRSGNTMTIAYTSITGGAIPATISWTPVSQGSASYSYTMLFGYGTNVPQSSYYGYVAGTPVADTSLLNTITIEYLGSVVKKYNLTYQAALTTSRYLLSQVQECADAGNTNCLSPTAITYQPGAAGVGSDVALTESRAIGINETPLYTTYDLNGDGRNDLLWYDGTWWVSFATSSGYAAPTNTGITAANAVFDSVDGSGVDGILAQVSGVWWYYKWSSSASAFEGTSTGVAVDTTTSGSFAIADVNGDGLPDLVTTRADGYLYVRLNTSTSGSVSFASTATKTISSTFALIESGTNVTRRLDFNGSGQQDLLGFYEAGNPTALYLLHFNGTTFTQTLLAIGSGFDVGVIDIADYNDDGCTDLLVATDPYETSLELSACNGAPASSLSLPYASTVVGGVDWDGDGAETLSS
jgi:hypothetical protein